jgi:hypothetical protein
MMSNINNFICAIASFIYDVKHVSMSQWDVENLTQNEVNDNHVKRQLR